jgi:hypothetical protein
MPGLNKHKQCINLSWIICSLARAAQCPAAEYVTCSAPRCQQKSHLCPGTLSLLVSTRNMSPARFLAHDYQPHCAAVYFIHRRSVFQQVQTIWTALSILRYDLLTLRSLLDTHLSLSLSSWHISLFATLLNPFKAQRLLDVSPIKIWNNIGNVYSVRLTQVHSAEGITLDFSIGLIFPSERLCGLVVIVPGYRSGGPQVRFPATRRKKKVVGLEWGPLSLVSSTEELLGRKSSGSGLEIREYGHRDSSRWPRGTLSAKSWH